MYSQVVLAQQAYNPQKLSGYLRSLIEEQDVAQARGQNRDVNTVCALMKLNANEDVHQVASRYGCQVVDSIGGIYFVQVPVLQLTNLSLEKGVQRIEAHEMPKLTMDETPERVGVVQAWQGDNLPQAFTGSGVIAGIADIGFDFTHPMFRDTDGNNRICQFINMAEKNGSGGIGVSYSSDELLAMRHSPRATIQTHGTHVASLMTGSPVQGQKASYSGVASGCDIVLSEVAANGADSTDNTSGSSASILLGIKRTFDYAAKAGKPCVTNLSMGGWIPITADATLGNQVISEMTGPGRILVSSAGNNGNYGATIKKHEDVKKITARFLGDPDKNSSSSQSKAKSIKCILVTSESQTVQFDFFGFGFWMTGGKIVQDSLILNTDSLKALNGDTCIIHVTNLDRASATVYAYKVQIQPPCAFDELYQFEITLDFDGFLGSFSQWIRYHGVEVTISSDYPCELYTNPELTPFAESPRLNMDESERFGCISYEHTIGWPACVNDVIGVGGTNRKSTSLASLSSQGPAWDGMVKPDVTAPGMYIHGAYNKFCNTFANDQDGFYDVITDDNGNNDYVIEYSGTSMSSPIVAGTIALWLQAKPDMTPLDIRDVLAHSCKQTDDDRVDDYPNNMYGYGVIDAYTGLLYILGIPNNINGISMRQPSSIRIILEGGNLIVKDALTNQLYKEGDLMLKVYTVDGKTVAQSRQNTMNLSGLSHGIYVVQVETKKSSSCGSTLIRL